jgi:hypothetical protein
VSDEIVLDEPLLIFHSFSLFLPVVSICSFLPNADDHERDADERGGGDAGDDRGLGV